MELLKTKCFSSMIFSFKNILTLFFKSIRLSKVVRYKSAAGTRRPEDVPCRSRKGPNVRYLQGTFRRVSGDQYKNEKKKKNYVSIPVFYRKNKYSNVLNGGVHGTSTGTSCSTSREPNDGPL